MSPSVYVCLCVRAYVYVRVRACVRACERASRRYRSMPAALTESQTGKTGQFRKVALIALADPRLAGSVRV